MATRLLFRPSGGDIVVMDNLPVHKVAGVSSPWADSSRFLARVHRSEIVLGVLIVVLRRHDVAAGGLCACELHVVLVVSLRALRVPLLGARRVRGMSLLLPPAVE